MYVMNTKLTLRMDDTLVKKAKVEAKRRHKSVSQMVADFVASLGRQSVGEEKPAPLTSSLIGILNGHRISEVDHKKHLREKHL